jgi:hypothetical protein
MERCRTVHRPARDPGLLAIPTFAVQAQQPSATQLPAPGQPYWTWDLRDPSWLGNVTLCQTMDFSLESGLVNDLRVICNGSTPHTQDIGPIR